jgi:hypothetical protein
VAKKWTFLERYVRKWSKRLPHHLNHFFLRNSTNFNRAEPILWIPIHILRWIMRVSLGSSPAQRAQFFECETETADLKPVCGQGQRGPTSGRGGIIPYKSTKLLEHMVDHVVSGVPEIIAQHNVAPNHRHLYRQDLLLTL